MDVLILFLSYFFFFTFVEKIVQINKKMRGEMRA